MRTRGLVALALSPLLAACGSAAAPAGDEPAPDQEHRAVSTVLDDGSGPVLCLTGVAESFPPQCDGPGVAGWDWDAVDHTGAGGTRWGEYVVRGTWADRTLTLTAPPRTAEAEDWEGAGGAGTDEPAVGTPCPEPPGGWSPAPAAGWDDPGFQRALALADRLDGVGEVWGDDGAGPRSGGFEGGVPDPERLVLNASVKGSDTARRMARERLRQVWDGDVCVSPARWSRVELQQVEQELGERDDLDLVSVASRAQVRLDVVHDDGTLQEEMDRTYGPGMVQVSSALVPVDG